MSSEWSKDEVLQAYLNIIYFGRGAYGISAAAKAYFDKPVEQLTVAEGGLLAALIQRPSTLDPAIDPDGAAKRWNWVLDGMVSMGALSEDERSQQVFPQTVSPEQARSNNVTTGPNGLIERQVTKELLDLFNIDEQTLNTQGLQITTTIDPKAQQAAENAVTKNLKGEMPDMRSAVVSIDPKTGGVKAYYGGSDAQGFDFAQAGLPTGSSFKVFALVAALEQGMGLGYQIDSSPVTVNGIKITNVEGEGCGVCNIAEALKRSLNTSYYRLMLKLKNGPSDVADAAHKAGIAESFPGVEHTLSEDGKGGPPNNGVVLGQYQSRVLDMASAYATLADSGVYHKPHFVEKVVNSRGEVLFDASTTDNTGEQRIPKAVADNVTAAMQPIAGYSRGHNLAGGRPSAAKTGTNQLGDTDANRDAWMVGYTPSLATAVWVGTTDGTQPLVTASGGQVYGSGIPSDIWKSTMDGALKGTDNESFPKPTEIGGYAGVPAAPPPPPPPPPSETVIQPSIEVAPGITIPLGPPTTITAPPGGGPVPPPPGGPEQPPPIGGGDAGAPLPPP
jgi:membrane peptidoglycan carboxypeptidase